MKRTARENGGIPLGHLRFRDSTGIKPYDWQKYWPRYGDLIREAGFEPNEMQAGRSDEMMIEKFVIFMRGLGRFPAHADLVWKRHQDPQFPSKDTFRRFGIRSQFAAKVLEYCQARSEYAELTSLCLAKMEQVESPERSNKEVDYGFVYLLKSGRNYKIGKTNAAGRREYELAIQLPEKPKTVHVIKTDDPTGIEAYWHQRFASKRKGGEWFELSAADVSVFKRRKFM